MENEAQYSVRPDTSPIRASIITGCEGDFITILRHVDGDMHELLFVDGYDMEVRSIPITVTEIVRMYELIRPKIQLLP